MSIQRFLAAGVIVLLAACSTEAPPPEPTGVRGLAVSPYAYLDGLVEVPGGFELYGELDDPGISLAGDPETAFPFEGPTVELRLNGSDFAYELTEDEPSLCACPELDSIGESVEFTYVVGEDLGYGFMPMHFDVFWTLGYPTILFQLVVLDGNGETLLGQATRQFTYAWRHGVDFPIFVDATTVAPGDLISLRLTLVDSPAESPVFVFNAGPGDRASYLNLPLR